MTQKPPSEPPAAQKDTLLHVSGIKKSFGSTKVLTDIHLDIKQGEFLTLLGPSGCGKTTLLRLIAGFEQPDAGAIVLDGQQMAGLPADKRPINTVFQQYALFPHMTVAQNVAYGLKIKKVPKAEIKTRVQAMLEMVFSTRKIAVLSAILSICAMASSSFSFLSLEIILRIWGCSWSSSCVESFTNCCVIILRLFLS